MIRVRLVTEPEYQEMRERDWVRVYKEASFYTLMREGGEQAFQDPDSQALIRGLHGARAVEERWWSTRTPEGELCLPALSNEAKYGLVLLHNSAQGMYTLFDREEGLYRFGRMIQEMLATGQDPEQAAIDGEREDRL